MVLLDVDTIVAELADFHAAGGRAIAEMTSSGWGRDVVVLKEISERSDIHVIAISGFYVEDCHPPYVADTSIEDLADLMVQELTAGADGTGICTGLLKSGISRPVVEGPEKKCAHAIALAQKRTGVSITTHTSGSTRFEIEGGNIGMQHLDLFEAEGVDPSRVIIGHTDENADIRQLVALAQRGAYVQFDVIGKIHWMLDETRVDLLCQMVDRGYQDHLMLSSDRCREMELKVGGGLGYDHVLRDFVPKLRQAGFDDALLHRILVENPARALSFEPQEQPNHSQGEIS
jgi:phosphotriesterase-related protein